MFAWLAQSCLAADFALRFDGTNDYVRVPYSSSLDLRHQVTLETWIKPDQVDRYQWILSRADSFRSAGNYILALYEGALQFSYWDGTGVDSNYVSDPVVAEGRWQHVAATFDFQTFQAAIYHDGRLIEGRWVTGARDVASPVLVSTPLVIGGGIVTHAKPGYAVGDPTSLFRGLIDEVRVWSSIRSLEELQTARCSNLSGTQVGLVAYLRFDEGSGLTASDLTVFGNHGELGGSVEERRPVWEVSGVQAACECPALAIRISEVELCWPTVAGHEYQVQYRSDLTGDAWLPLQATNLVGTGSRTCITDKIADGQPRRFYRLDCIR